MKKLITLTLVSMISLSMIKAQTFSDDFESYTVGSYLGSSSPNWTTWSGTTGGAEDVQIVTTNALSGTNSIYFSSTSANGGPQDVVLPFGGVHNTGQFTFNASFNVPTNKTAYFNFQATGTIGQTWALDCHMEANGDLIFENGGTTMLTTTYPPNTWFDLEVDINLNTNSWEVFVNNVSQGTFSNNVYQVASLDLYPANAQASFWVDDVSYNVVPYTLLARNGGVTQLNIGNGLVGQQKTPSVVVRNLGTQSITSFDITVDYNGIPVTQNVTGVNIASLAFYTVNFTSPITLVAGSNPATATISNVNGITLDDDSGDDVKTITINPIQPAAGKMVIAEEATGTWCGWCPRGAVSMDAMAAKYDGFYKGIAVHNNDPMEVTVYDAGMGALIGGYPAALVDRTAEIDPTGIEQDFLQRIVIAPKAFLVDSSTYYSASRELTVNITSTFQQAVSGNYRIACVLTEDSITGTASGYAQANYYAGGGSGVMGGYELLPDPVPASQMRYDHVAREINPSFAGLANSFPASVNVNDVFTHTFTFTLDNAWDEDRIHVIAMLIDPSGQIDNASSSGIVNVIDNTSVNEKNTAAASLKLYPNPSSDRSFLSMNLGNEANIQLSIYQINGALVVSKDYGKLSGAQLLPIETANLTTGIYFVNVVIDGQSTMMKLIAK